MSTTVHRVTDQLSQPVQGALALAALAEVLDDRAVTIKALSWSPSVHWDPQDLDIRVAGGEPAVDALADLFALEPEPDGQSGNYCRRGTFSQFSVRVWSGRTRPLCGCGEACNHQGA